MKTRRNEPAESTHPMLTRKRARELALYQYQALPDDVIYDNILPFLDMKTTSCIARTSSEKFSLFHQTLNIIGDAAKLLYHVARGEQVKAQTMLIANLDLLFQYAKVTDRSGRTFNRITAFQYAVWAKDTNMWLMILSCLPTEPTQRLKYLTALLEQYDNMPMEHGKHYDFLPLLTAYQNFIQFANENTADKVTYLWQHQLNLLWLEIGKMQRTLPTHIINEYCHPNRSFWINSRAPYFDDMEGLPRSITLSNGHQIYPLPTELGNVYTLIRANFQQAVHCSIKLNDKGLYRLSCARIDMNAIFELCFVRTKDLDYIESLRVECKQVNHLRP